MTEASHDLRLLVVARQPFRLDDVVSDELDGQMADARLVRRPSTIEAALDDLDPNVVLVDTTYQGHRGFDAIAEVAAHAPAARVLALTPDPPPHADVARAARAGAVGFIDVNAEPSEFADAKDQRVNTLSFKAPTLTGTLSIARVSSVLNRPARSHTDPVSSSSGATVV